MEKFNERSNLNAVVASTGPRSRERGWADEADEKLGIAKLQRDRAHVSADGGKLTKTKPTIVEVLQRDRAHVSADGT